ncbi:hypothetical protein AVO42_01330 [Thiomicrospira sp. XS5]|uniref:hypothetical protein n=1 Tax=Thiomicrospira sp. XS5 TaxID=1775636 RepID=UPI00074A2549|nr:hypothetical protein [Thiomicrospira sp. XS5]KUJ74087.1 hypothetical protein AVO42_01330 [Thiomicrospira sp. XS5]
MTLVSTPVRLSVLLAFLSLSACSLTPPKSMMDVQAGYTFTLKKPVTIPSDDARAFIQNGQMTTHHGFNRYEQHCELEVKNLSRKPQVIQPDTFTITKVRIDSEAIASRQTPQVVYAMNDINPYPNQTLRDLPTYVNLADNDGGDGIDPTMDLVYLYLESKTQPNILRLTCAGSLSRGNPLDAPRSQRPQQKQINQILGSYGEVAP